uniref:Pericardin n=1 Tax=Apis cerana TaxID=7461 RepID=V9IKR2_APICE
MVQHLEQVHILSRGTRLLEVGRMQMYPRIKNGPKTGFGCAGNYQRETGCAQGSSGAPPVKQALLPFPGIEGVQKENSPGYFGSPASGCSGSPHCKMQLILTLEQVSILVQAGRQYSVPQIHLQSVLTVPRLELRKRLVLRAITRHV